MWWTWEPGRRHHMAWCLDVSGMSRLGHLGGDITWPGAWMWVEWVDLGTWEETSHGLVLGCEWNEWTWAPGRRHHMAWCLDVSGMSGLGHLGGDITWPGAWMWVEWVDLGTWEETSHGLVLGCEWNEWTWAPGRRHHMAWCLDVSGMSGLGHLGGDITWPGAWMWVEWVDLGTWEETSHGLVLGCEWNEWT